MSTIYYVASSVDGFIADPDDSLEWLIHQDVDGQGPLNYEDFASNVGAAVMGRTTYDWVRREQPDEWMFADMPVWVLTHRPLDNLPPDAASDSGGDAPNIETEDGDIHDLHARMTRAAAASGRPDVWVVGGGEVAGQFADAGLLDQVIVSVAPVTLGAGRPLLPRRLDLELVETARNRAFVASRYQVGGQVRDRVVAQEQ